MQAGERSGRDSVSSNTNISSNTPQGPLPPPHGPASGPPAMAGSHSQAPVDPRSARFHPYQREANQSNIVNSAKDPRLRSRGGNTGGRSNGSAGQRASSNPETAPKNIINCVPGPKKPE